jgi:hypothetical protein
VTAAKSPRSKRHRLALITAIIKYPGSSDQCSIRILVNRFARQVLGERGIFRRDSTSSSKNAGGGQSARQSAIFSAVIKRRLVLVPIRYGFYGVLVDSAPLIDADVSFGGADCSGSCWNIVGLGVAE